MNKESIYRYLVSKLLSFGTPSQSPEGTNSSTGDLLSVLIKLCRWELVNKIFFQFLLSIVIHHVCITYVKPGNHKALHNTLFHRTAVNARPARTKITLQHWVRVGRALSDHHVCHLRSLDNPSNLPVECLPSPTGFRLQKKAGLHYSLQDFVNHEILHLNIPCNMYSYVTRVHNNSCISEKINIHRNIESKVLATKKAKEKKNQLCFSPQEHQRGIK